MEKDWQLCDGHDAELVRRFAEELNSGPVLARVLLNRGIEDVEAARQFFIPKLEHLHDPFLMAGMDDAVQRIQTALASKEKILIYGDYDVDGTSSTSMMLMFFRKLNHPVDFYVPDRIKEGYGLSRTGIEHARADGFGLIITVDLGVTAVEEIAFAHECGLDVIVCDHHQPGQELPPALAVLNPKRADCAYPFKELAGVGVAFKLLQALQRHLQLDESTVFELLYFVALGSAADIVPLVDENRALVKHGLKDLALSRRNVGLRSLVKITGLADRDLGTGQVVFVLAPRINAAGRLGDAGRAVRLLTTDDEEVARDIASVLESENRTRREIDEATLIDAVALVESAGDPASKFIFVLNSDEWHPGVIGIVASRIVEKYFRPTVMIATDNGEGKGSARSIPGFDIYAALKSCEDLMLSFGGHKYAAGLSIETDKIPLLREKLSQVAAQNLSDAMLVPKLNIDSELRFREIDATLLKLFRKMAPFGPQNARPTFLSRELQIVGTPSIVGKNHLKFKVRQDGVVMDCIGFNLGEKLYRISAGERSVEMVYVIDENEYKGRSTIQLRVKDLR
ncbi:MAG: single-stranded-DNA-specific exonuclease RecJ [Calditrichaeota bacterium]|nr:single-stranded-DNA-specific exonuclease RecJ [Calditrichota bacterium]